MEDKKVKKYDSMEALKIVKNFVEKEYEEGRENFRRYVGSELDKHADYSVTKDAYANYWVGKNSRLYRVLTKIRQVTGDRAHN